MRNLSKVFMQQLRVKLVSTLANASSTPYTGSVQFAGRFGRGRPPQWSTKILVWESVSTPQQDQNPDDVLLCSIPWTLVLFEISI